MSAAIPSIAEYVRANYRRTLRTYIIWFSLSTPMFAAMRIREYGFSWEWVAAAVAAWALACCAAATLAVLVLTIAGWWNLNNKASPYIPAAILLTTAVLGWVYVTTYY